MNYDWYAPCVGAAGGGAECGERAYQSQYKEYGLPVFVAHAHALQTSYGQLEYIIK